MIRELLLEFAHRRKLMVWHTTGRPGSLSHDVIHNIVEDAGG